MSSIPRIPLEVHKLVEELEQTPLDAPTPISRLTAEVKLLREQSARVADFGMKAVAVIPELEKKIARLQLWQQWLPTAALVAIALKLWLRP
jgi:hypothetical protein